MVSGTPRILVYTCTDFIYKNRYLDYSRASKAISGQEKFSLSSSQCTADVWNGMECLLTKSVKYI